MPTLYRNNIKLKNSFSEVFGEKRVLDKISQISENIYSVPWISRISEKEAFLQ